MNSVYLAGPAHAGFSYGHALKRSPNITDKLRIGEFGIADELCVDVPAMIQHQTTRADHS
jgi:hypothetical protein